MKKAIFLSISALLLFSSVLLMARLNYDYEEPNVNVVEFQQNFAKMILGSIGINESYVERTADNITFVFKGNINLSDDGSTLLEDTLSWYNTTLPTTRGVTFQDNVSGKFLLYTNPSGFIDYDNGILNFIPNNYGDVEHVYISGQAFTSWSDSSSGDSGMFATTFALRNTTDSEVINTAVDNNIQIQIGGITFLDASTTLGLSLTDGGEDFIIDEIRITFNNTVPQAQIYTGFDVTYSYGEYDVDGPLNILVG